MIFVTVGTHIQGYDRVVKKMDEIAGKTEEPVIMQIGYTTYLPAHAEFFNFTDNERILNLNRDARVVISHAGVGSIMTALSQKTPIIIVPRQKKYGEHWDDHQLEIAEAMKMNRNVRVVYEVEDLETYLAMDFKFMETGNGNRGLVNRISECINHFGDGAASGT